MTGTAAWKVRVNTTEDRLPTSHGKVNRHCDEPLGQLVADDPAYVGDTTTVGAGGTVLRYVQILFTVSVQIGVLLRRPVDRPHYRMGILATMEESVMSRPLESALPP